VASSLPSSACAKAPQDSGSTASQMVLVRWCLVLAWFLSVVAEDMPKESAEDEKVDHSKPYTAPAVPGLHWSETFDGDVWSRWSHSSTSKHNGRFKVETRVNEAIIGDLGLNVPDEAKKIWRCNHIPRGAKLQGIDLYCTV